MTAITCCRSCGSSDLTRVLDLGLQPIANALVDPAEGGATEDRFPLELTLCGNCALLQVTETIPPAVLFGQDYPYFSSVSAALLAHSRAHAEALLATRKLGADSLVVEVASNDGYLLRNFVEAGIPVLGVDPAAGPAAAAVAVGVPTIVTFFNAEAAQAIVAKRGQADVILANNVLAHVEGINNFVEGFAVLLKQDGIAQFEFPYLKDLVELCAFDTVYHEHVFYYSLTALGPLFARHGLSMIDAEPIAIHGGSLRLTVGKTPGQTPRLEGLLAAEQAAEMDKLHYYADFGQRVATVRDRLRTLVSDLTAGGARMCAYGAAAKGSTLLNYVNLDPGQLDYVVDLNPHKVGKLMPGVALPIRPVQALTDDPPDYLLLLAWNFGAEIMQQQHVFAQNGGRFIMPVPVPEVVISAGR